MRYPDYIESFNGMETRASEYIIGKLFYEVDPKNMIEEFAKRDYSTSIMQNY